jgi:SAM-dependent methyltransferase
MTATDAVASEGASEMGTEELAGRMFESGVAALEIGAAYVGLKLGFYEELRTPKTADELADATGCAPRYAREWLRSQALSGFVTMLGDEPATARFTLADGADAVLTEPTSPAYLGGLPHLYAALGTALPLVVDAYRTGDGVPYAAYGPDAVIGQAALNRPAFVNALVAQWLPEMPDVVARLRDTGTPARVADFGCGYGWSAIELAKAFPQVRVDGFDGDEASIATARRNAAEYGVADRVDFDVADLGTAGPGAPRYDVSFFFECVHDFPRPVEALRYARTSTVTGGTVIVMDEAAAETFTAPADPVQRFLGAASAVWCLPQGMVGADPEPVGALMRPDQLADLAERAGYAKSEVLPIEHDVWRFYRLTP